MSGIKIKGRKKGYRKCHGRCGLSYPIEELKKDIHGFLYCEECYEKLIHPLGASWQDVIKATRDFFDYAPNEKINTLFLRRLKVFHENEFYDYSYEDILYVLKYIKQWFPEEIDREGYGIGIVPYYYDRAMQYKEEQQEKATKSKDIFPPVKKNVFVDFGSFHEQDKGRNFLKHKKHHIDFDHVEQYLNQKYGEKQ
jgi:hypothetical protein